MAAALRRAAGWPGVAVLVAVVIFAAGLCQTTAGHAMLRTVGLFQEPIGYTSLAFVNPQGLPEQLTSERASVPVSFVIRNSGNTTRDYRWSVLVIQPGSTRREHAGNTRVASGRGASISQSAEITCAQGRVQIVVKLARPAETIDAWTTCPPPRS